MRGAANVVGEIASDLDLEVRPALGDPFTTEPADLLVGVAEPTGRRRVRGISGALQLRFALPPSSARFARAVRPLRRSERVGDVSEIDASHDLLRTHVDEQLPQRLALDLRPEIPHGVDDRRGREVEHALLWADPAKLRIANDSPPERAHVGGDLLEGQADDERGQRLRGGHAQLVAASDRERQPVSFRRRRRSFVRRMTYAAE